DSNPAAPCNYSAGLVVVPRNAFFLSDVLILGGGLQDHAGGKFVDHPALDLLPGRLMVGIAKSSRLLQLLTPAGKLGIIDQYVGGALAQVYADAIARSQDRQPASRCSLRRSVQDRGRTGGSGLPSVADARQRMDASLYQAGGRLHVHHFRAARITDRPG